MPWSETSPMDQRIEFIADFQRHLFSVSELCARFGISRKTAYKWAARYQAHGLEGLSDQSRRPRTCPHETPTVIVQALIEARHRHWASPDLVDGLITLHETVVRTLPG